VGRWVSGSVGPTLGVRTNRTGRWVTSKIGVARGPPIDCPRMEITPVTGLVLVAFGLLVGAYGTLVGAGGGFLIVPVLLLAWHLPPAQAAGTSLVVVFLNAVAGSFQYARQQRIDYRSGLWFAAATVPGSIIGAFLAESFSGRAFEITFGVMLLLVAAFLIWKPVRSGPATDARPDRLGLGIAVSFVIGFLSSALGIGGGIFHVPAMIHLLHFAPAVAAATSTFILAFSSLIGASTHVTLGNVLWVPAALMGIGVIGGAQVGAAIAKRVKGAVVVRLLSVALVIVAVRLLLR
jgi:uncharacterized membrane protein YfcA